MTFKFILIGGGTERQTGPHHWQAQGFEIQADSGEAAYMQALTQLPEGARIFCWYEERDIQPEV